MLKINILLYLLFYIPAISQNNSWKFYKIDNQLQLKLPDTPFELDVPRTVEAAQNKKLTKDPMIQVTQAYTTEDPTARYSIIRIPLKELPVLPRTFAERKFYYENRTIPFMFMNTKAEVLDHTIVKKDGIDLITIKTQNFDSTGSIQIKYIRVLRIGKITYQLHFLPFNKTGENTSVQRALFFDAFRVTSAKP